MFILSTSVFSDVIIPTGVTLLTGAKTNETPLTRMIDGSGLSDASLTATLATVTHDSTDPNEARLFDSAPSSVRLDLGGIYDISEVFYWNNNTSASNDVSAITYNFLDSSLAGINTSGAVSIPGPLVLVEMPANQYASETIVQGVRYVDVTFTPRAGATSYAPGEVRLIGSALIFADSFEALPICPAAGSPCALTDTCCNSGCNDLQTDPLNCGSCGNECGTESHCESGICIYACEPICTDGTEPGCCSAGCTDLYIDAYNCGACDVVCPSGLCLGGCL